MYSSKVLTLFYQVLKEEGSVVNASWPEAGTSDDSLTKAADHLMECTHDFR